MGIAKQPHGLHKLKKKTHTHTLTRVHLAQDVQISKPDALADLLLPLRGSRLRRVACAASALPAIRRHSVAPANVPEPNSGQLPGVCLCRHLCRRRRAFVMIPRVLLFQYHAGAFRKFANFSRYNFAAAHTHCSCVEFCELCRRLITDTKHIATQAYDLAELRQCYSM